MGMGAQSQRGAAAMQPQQQVPMGGAPQGLMALMQQRGKGAGLPGGMPQGGPGMGKPDPQMLAAMQAFQQQGGQGGMPQGGPQMGFGQAMASDQDIRGQLQSMGLDGPRSPAQEMLYQQFMAQQPQMTPMGPMTQQQIGGMSQDMRQQMNAMQNQADMQRRLASGDFPGAPGKGAGLPLPRTQEEMQRAMDKMAGASMGPPPGVRVSQPAPGKGGGMPPRPGVPSTMVNPARPQVRPRPQPARPKGFDGFR
jgi:hypothetical protein